MNAAAESPTQDFVPRIEFDKFKKELEERSEHEGKTFAETEAELRVEIEGFESAVSRIDIRFDEVLEAVGKIQRFAATQQFSELVSHVGSLLDGQTRLNNRLNGIDERLNGHDNRLNGIGSRLDNIDDRLDRIEGLLSQLVSRP